METRGEWEKKSHPSRVTFYAASVTNRMKKKSKIKLAGGLDKEKKTKQNEKDTKQKQKGDLHGDH